MKQVHAQLMYEAFSDFQAHSDMPRIPRGSKVNRTQCCRSTCGGFRTVVNDVMICLSNVRREFTGPHVHREGLEIGGRKGEGKEGERMSDWYTKNSE